MKLSKTILIFGYLFLSGLWFVANLFGIFDIVYFNLAVAIYFIFTATIIFGVLVRGVGDSKRFIFVPLAILFFGLAIFTWFYLSFLSYIFSFLNFILFTISLFLTSEKINVGIQRSSVIKDVLKSLALVILVVWLCSKFENPLKIYISVKNLLLLILTVYSVVKSKSFWLLMSVLGFLIQLFGGLIYYFRGLNLASYISFLYLSGMYLVIFGFIKFWGQSGFDFSDSDDNLILFKNVSYQIPISLNSF